MVSAWLVLGIVMVMGSPNGLQGDEKRREVLPLAVLPFQDRGTDVEEVGVKVADLLFANLSARDGIYLVERSELDKVLNEQELAAAGVVDAKQSAVIGQLTGAKVLVTGSVLQSGDNLYLVAKLIGVETTRVLGASVKGKSKDDLDALVTDLAGEITTKLGRDSEVLAARPVERVDLVASLRKSLGKGRRPTVWIEIQERHIGQATTDPAAETELTAVCAELGFSVIDRAKGAKSDADIVIVGEGVSQFAARHGELVSVKARLEIKAIRRDTARVIAADRQTTVAVDAAEVIASKSAFQDGASRIAQRLLPKVVGNK